MSIDAISNIPSFPADVVKDLPLYYQAVIQRLADTGRAVITDSEKPDEKTEG